MSLTKEFTMQEARKKCEILKKSLAKDAAAHISKCKRSDNAQRSFKTNAQVYLRLAIICLQLSLALPHVVCPGAHVANTLLLF
ncbi:hypothetical protein EVAR_48065_1 [Eumeta japonica]|uniref:Uncharacterized protein n=1 Tax=Eumeta variegata TaxID=151549 RepID=A0A4C1X9P9_EUMVA|nr:hypothetical protein EVAR_48065_1 [Eumeta japonica]